MVDTATTLPATAYSAAPDVVFERMGDTMLAVNLGTDMILELNGTAARLVDILLSGSTDREAAEAMAAEYGVGLDLVWENVETTIRTLVEERVLTAAGGGDGT